MVCMPAIRRPCTRSNCQCRSPNRSATRRSSSSNSMAVTGCRACSTRARSKGPGAFGGASWQDRSRHCPYGEDARQRCPRPLSQPGSDPELLRGRSERHGRRDLAGRRLVHRDPRPLSGGGRRQAVRGRSGLGPQRTREAPAGRRQAVRFDRDHRFSGFRRGREAGAGGFRRRRVDVPQRPQLAHGIPAGRQAGL